MMQALVSRALRGLIRLYQVTLSPLVGNRCRFYPTCSQYADEAIAVHGPLRGSWLAVKRLCRCQPFCQGGFDPVPGTRRDEPH
mgnify:CR=1 FL=1